jgi:hypothetical protein
MTGVEAGPVGGSMVPEYVYGSGKKGIAKPKVKGRRTVPFTRLPFVKLPETATEEGPTKLNKAFLIAYDVRV